MTTYLIGLWLSLMLLLTILVVCFVSVAQTRIDLPTQSRGGTVLEAGKGLMSLQSPDRQQIAIDVAVIPTMLRQSAMLSVSALAPSSCYNGQIGSPGAAHWDTIVPGWPPLLPSGLVGVMWVSQTGTISVRLCNSSTITTTAITDNFAATIIRAF